jgi:hypothetical protein
MVWNCRMADELGKIGKELAVPLIEVLSLHFAWKKWGKPRKVSQDGRFPRLGSARSPVERKSAALTVWTNLHGEGHAGLHAKCPLSLSHFDQNWSKTSLHLNFMKIFSVNLGLLQSNRRTDRHGEADWRTFEAVSVTYEGLKNIDRKPHVVQTGSGVHSISYPMGTGSSSPVGKGAAAWNWPLTTSSCRGPENRSTPPYAFMA